MPLRKRHLFILVGSILSTSFFLGLPVFHYFAAVLVSTTVRYRGAPAGLLTPLGSFDPPRRDVVPQVLLASVQRPPR